MTQIKVINYEDSLQRIAKMSPEEREKKIDEIINQRKKEEEEKRRQEQLKKELEEGGGFIAAGPGGSGPGGPGGPRVPGLGGSSWYFYNPSARGLGAAEFKKIWGSRKNEDNWRRSNKNVVSFDNDDFDTAEDKGYVIDENGDTVRVSTDWQEPSYYLKDLPLTDDQLLASNSKMLTAYYKLANVYWDQLEDNLKTIETLETMNDRFQPNKHQLAAYYSLYRLHGEEDHTTEEEFYKNKILKEYPETDYAKLILDPEYFKKENLQNEDVVAFYNKAYSNYKSGYYQYVIEQCDKGLESFPKSELKPKFELLKVLCLGQTEGKEKLISELKKLNLTYKDHEVGEKAIEIIAQLQVAEDEAKKAAEREENRKKSPYTFDETETHNCIIMLPTKGKTRTQKSRIVTFNSVTFRSAKLKTSSVLFNDEYQMVTIKSFKNADEVKKYIVSFLAEKARLKGVNDQELDIFGISFNNYATFYKLKDVEQYLDFYETNYLKSE